MHACIFCGFNVVRIKMQHRERERRLYFISFNNMLSYKGMLLYEEILLYKGMAIFFHLLFCQTDYAPTLGPKIDSFFYFQLGGNEEYKKNAKVGNKRFTTSICNLHRINLWNKPKGNNNNIHNFIYKATWEHLSIDETKS